MKTSAGGVARNMAEALKKLDFDPVILSAVGNDLFGRELMLQFEMKQMDTSRILSCKYQTSAVYSALLNNGGECLFGMGDMDIHNEINVEYINKHAEIIQSAPIVVLDGNIPVTTISAILEICFVSSTPVWFEPTEIRKAKKICRIDSKYLNAVRYISPNINELRSILEEAQHYGLVNQTFNNDLDFSNEDNCLRHEEHFNEISQCFQIFPELKMMLITRGRNGIWVIHKDNSGKCLKSFRHDAPRINEIASVSGAGDCLNAGFISGILQDLPWADCARLATNCAGMSLMSHQTVPTSF